MCVVVLIKVFNDVLKGVTAISIALELVGVVVNLTLKLKSGIIRKFVPVLPVLLELLRTISDRKDSSVLLEQFSGFSTQRRLELLCFGIVRGWLASLCTLDVDSGPTNERFALVLIEVCINRSPIFNTLTIELHEIFGSVCSEKSPKLCIFFVKVSVNMFVEQVELGLPLFVCELVRVLVFFELADILLDFVLGVVNEVVDVMIKLIGFGWKSGAKSDGSGGGTVIGESYITSELLVVFHFLKFFLTGPLGVDLAVERMANLEENIIYGPR